MRLYRTPEDMDKPIGQASLASGHSGGIPLGGVVPVALYSRSNPVSYLPGRADMNRLVLLALLAGCCAGCGSSMSTAPVLLPGAVNERTIDERGVERIGVDFVAGARSNEHTRGN